jgi:hypothetical protein
MIESKNELSVDVLLRVLAFERVLKNKGIITEAEITEELKAIGEELAKRMHAALIASQS